MSQDPPPYGAGMMPAHRSLLGVWRVTARPGGALIAQLGWSRGEVPEDPTHGDGRYHESGFRSPERARSAIDEVAAARGVRLVRGRMS